MLRKLGGIVLAVVAILGFKFYNKHSTYKDVEKQLVALCESDAACVAAVQTHLEGCFDASYRMGGRRSSSELRSDQLVACINERAGVDYFSVAE